MSPAPSDTATLLVSCADRRGLVAALAQLLYGHGANILDSDQHTDASVGQFFQRLRFDLSEMHTDRGTLERAIGEVAARFSMEWRIAYGNRRKRMAIFVSRYDHCLHDLLWRHRAGELDCELPLVLSNHSDLAATVEQLGHRLHVIPVSAETKRQQEDAQLELLREHEIDLVVLARYMQVLTAEFVAHYPHRIINIHHSFLPAFIGGKPYHQAHERGVKLIGATAHYATADLDDGPIIEQAVVRASHRDSVEDLVRKGRDVERVALAAAVRAHLENRVIVHGRRTVVFD